MMVYVKMNHNFLIRILLLELFKVGYKVDSIHFLALCEWGQLKFIKNTFLLSEDFIVMFSM